MKEEKLVAVAEIIRHYNAEPDFINSLRNYELIDITTVDKSDFINSEQLHHFEKLLRLHYDLEINVDGIDVIMHLLQRIQSMQDEMISLKNKLSRYKDL